MTRSKHRNKRNKDPTFQINPVTKIGVAIYNI